jgi:hypothetical protein
MKNSYCNLVGKHVGKKQFARSRWEVNIKIDLKQVGSEDMYCIRMVHDGVQ